MSIRRKRKLLDQIPTLAFHVKALNTSSEGAVERVFSQKKKFYFIPSHIQDTKGRDRLRELRQILKETKHKRAVSMNNSLVLPLNDRKLEEIRLENSTLYSFEHRPQNFFKSKVFKQSIPRDTKTIGDRSSTPYTRLKKHEITSKVVTGHSSNLIVNVNDEDGKCYWKKPSSLIQNKIEDYQPSQIKKLYIEKMHSELETQKKIEEERFERKIKEMREKVHKNEIELQKYNPKYRYNDYRILSKGLPLDRTVIN